MKRKGAFGEDCAAEYLQKQGYQIVGRNFRIMYGEVDIIARKDTYIVFVEVKARCSDTYGRPCESVGLRKQQRLSLVADAYLSANPVSLQPRFDVIEIITNPGFDRVLRLNHIESAFDAQEISGGTGKWA